MGEIVKHFIIAINDPLIYKSASGPFWKYCYGVKHMFLKRKHYTNYKLVFGMKL